MNYIIDFSLVSIMYLSITAVFYRLQPKAPSLRNTLFGALLFLGVFFAVMDVLVVVIEPVSFRLPAWLVFAANSVFLISVQLSSALFFLYSLVLTGYIKSGFRRVAAFSMIPFLITAALLVLPLGPSGIFYIDSEHIYRRGAIYAVLYIDTALYLVASIAAVFLRRQQLPLQKRLCICAFLVALFISMLIQYNRPELLLNAMGNALALTLIYHVLEAPSEHIDALTGVLNRAAFSTVVQDAYNQARRCTLLIFPINALGTVNNSLGMSVGDRLLTQFAAYLRGAFSAGYIFRIAGDAFGALMTGGEYCDRQSLERLLSGMPESFRLGQMDVRPEISVACVNSEDTDDWVDMTSLAAHILRQNGERRLESALVADSSFREELREEERMERELSLALAEGRIEVFYQPLHDCSGKLAALEALVRIRGTDGKHLPTQESVELSERNGSIHLLSAMILRRVCEFIRDNNAGDWGLHHIGVNLSALQFMRDDLCRSVSSILDEYGVAHRLISFEITETATASVSDISVNMQKMNDAGFSFLLDDFGTGYANFNNLSRLPLLCVKLDKSLLWQAAGSPERMAFLRGVAEMLQTMGLTTVCEGVETREQAALLGELGVDMLQGYLFSKPLPPDELLRYIERTGGDGL